MSEKKILISVQEYKRLKAIEQHCLSEHRSMKTHSSGEKKDG